MQLAPHIQQIAEISPEVINLLWEATHSVDLSNPASLTKEEAFFDACHRYEVETSFFNSDKFFYSGGVTPSAVLTQKLRPYFEYLDQFFPNHTVFRAQVVKNIPGRMVKPHIDPRLYHSLSHRLHAVLQTNEASGHVYFNENKSYDMEIFQMPTGFLYDFDNITPHSAFNLGVSDRIHVITDLMPIDVLRARKENLIDNPNYTIPGTFDTYHRHVKAVNDRYGGEEGLREEYLRRLA